MNYKNIIKSKDLRIKILSLLDFIPDKLMIHIQYFIKFNRFLKLKNPKRFTEKLQWYKLYYRKPLMKKCVDKYLVRNYLKSKNLGNISNELYGIYVDPQNIDFVNLPNQFVIKTTDGGGNNNIIICKNKDELNKRRIIKKLNKWTNQKTNKSAGREWPYRNLNSKIIIEKYLEDQKSELNDYKFFCFNGKPKLLQVDTNRYNNHKQNFYDMHWNLLNLSQGNPINDNFKLPQSKILNKLYNISKKLSQDFPFVRVDLYNINGKIIFGELTFFPWSGYMKLDPDYFDFKLGNEFILPEVYKKDDKK